MLSLREVTSILDELESMGCFEIMLSGGEPMAHPHFWQILEVGGKFRFSNGDLLPCISFQRPAGNIRKKSLREIWERAESLREVRSVTMGKLTDCFPCPVKEHCPRCPGVAWLEDGDMFGRSEGACAIAAVKASIDKISKPDPELSSVSILTSLDQ